VNPFEWEQGRYKPTPTIIEAAQALYRGHNVGEISRSEAGAINLSKTSDAIDQIIDNAKRNYQKVICFITGVPGSGKTLAGLNIANRRLQFGKDEHAVFLSGNGPLVTVLREALVRDDVLKGEKRKMPAERLNHLFRTFTIFGMSISKISISLWKKWSFLMRHSELGISQ
jgi:adenylylsulfate kinase-like enzyme